jgi:hypothetical protein
MCKWNIKYPDMYREDVWQSESEESHGEERILRHGAYHLEFFFLQPTRNMFTVRYELNF